MIPLKKMVLPSYQDDDDNPEPAARAGAWYVYQAIFDTSDSCIRATTRQR